MCRSVEKELRVLLGVAKSIVGLLLFLVWVLFSGFCIYVIRGWHLSATPINYCGTALIWSSMGQKKFCCINGVVVLMRVCLQENVWWFLPGGQKKWL